MHRFAERLPAAALVIVLIIVAAFDLLGFDWGALPGLSILGIFPLIFGLLILGLCLTGPLTLAVLYVLKRIKERSRVTSRVADTGQQVRKRAEALRAYRKRLAYFQSIPADRRKAEAADEGERDMKALIAALEAE